MGKGSGDGALGGMFRGKAGTDAGNVFTQHQDTSNKALSNYLTRGTQDARTEAMADPTLSKYFGQGMDRLSSEEADLSGRGYGLQQEDREAYGQSAGDLARMFGGQEQSLAQSMANRGLSSSGAAGRSFAGLQGNKMERLAGLQRQIADNRMKSNLDRLNSTRQFLSGRMGQYTGELGRRDDFSQNKAAMGQSTLKAMTDQSNENMSQRQASAQDSPFMTGLKGAIVGGSTAAGAYFGGPQGAQAGKAGGEAATSNMGTKKPRGAGDGS